MNCTVRTGFASIGHGGSQLERLKVFPGVEALRRLSSREASRLRSAAATLLVFGKRVGSNCVSLTWVDSPRWLRRRNRTFARVGKVDLLAASYPRRRSALSGGAEPFSGNDHRT
jgi:hypothetical protein